MRIRLISLFSYIIQKKKKTIKSNQIKILRMFMVEAAKLELQYGYSLIIRKDKLKTQLIESQIKSIKIK